MSLSKVNIVDLIIKKSITIIKNAFFFIHSNNLEKKERRKSLNKFINNKITNNELYNSNCLLG